MHLKSRSNNLKTAFTRGITGQGQQQNLKSNVYCEMEGEGDNNDNGMEESEMAEEGGDCEAEIK